jgi:flagellar transcriptional activator FlhD
MMRDSQTLDSIRELNMSYLLLAQRLLDQDRVAAIYRLGLTDSAADMLAALTPAQTHALAQATELIWQLRLDDLTLISALTENTKSAALSHLHASIVLAEKPCKRKP